MHYFILRLFLFQIIRWEHENILHVSLKAPDVL